MAVRKKGKTQSPTESKMEDIGLNHGALSWSLLKHLKGIFATLFPAKQKLRGQHMTNLCQSKESETLALRAVTQQSSYCVRCARERWGGFKDLQRPEQTSVSVYCSYPVLRTVYWAEEHWCDKTPFSHSPVHVPNLMEAHMKNKNTKQTNKISFSFCFNIKCSSSLWQVTGNYY